MRPTLKALVVLLSAAMAFGQHSRPSADSIPLGTKGDTCIQRVGPGQVRVAQGCAYNAPDGTMRGAAGATLETNGANNSSQSTLNLENSTGAGEIDFTNPSGGTVHGTVHNTTITVNGTSCPLGGSCTTSGGALPAGPTSPNGVPQICTETPSGGVAPANCTWQLQGVPSNAQSGAGYTFAATDRGAHVTVSNASAEAATLPDAGSAGFDANFYMNVCNVGAGTWTIQRGTSSTFSVLSVGGSYQTAQTSFSLAQFQCASITTQSDGTDWFATLYTGGGGAGSWSALTDPTVNKSFSMSGFSTTFNFNAAQVPFSFINTSPATASASTGSPEIQLCGQYWNGATGNDCFWFDVVPNNGTNASTVFYLNHSGTTGSALFVYPGNLNTPNGVNDNISCGNGGASQCNVTLSGNNGGGVTVNTNGIGTFLVNLGGGATAQAQFKPGSASPTVDTVAVMNSSGQCVAGIGEQGSFNVCIPNDATTGTTLNKLAILAANGSSSTAVLAGPSATSGVIGIVVNGAGTTGRASVAVAGIAPCVFDGATTVNHYVQASATAGDCHDAGAAAPGTGEIIGFVQQTLGAAGTANVLVQLQKQ